MKPFACLLNMRNTQALLLLLFLFTFSCKKTENKEALVIQSFLLEKANNPSLTADVSFEIKGDSIISQQANIFDKLLKATFTSNADAIRIAGRAQVSGETENNFGTALMYTLFSDDGRQKNYYVKINWITDSLPHIFINTEGNAAINSKEDYVNASIKIQGKGKYPDYNGNTQIRGRGNSTWGYPKKPYRLKLSSKAELFGLSAERDWVLLANFLDPTLMLNAVAMKIGQQVEMPFTNHIIPVNVSVNGSYVGSYTFTEQIEVEYNRVNIGDDGLLLELDTYYDEEYKFFSQNYELPVMIKNPELSSTAEQTPIQQTFNAMEDLIAAAEFPNNSYKDHIDIHSVANHLIVHMLTDNEELNHPKSTYIHKTTSGKFTMGPLWDFDWAYGYEGGNYFGSSYTRPIFWFSRNPQPIGTSFFARFLSDPEYVALLKQKWADYKNNHFDELIKFVEEYALKVEGSKNADYIKWKTGDAVFMNDVKNLRQWLINRKGYIDSYFQTL